MINVSGVHQIIYGDLWCHRRRDLEFQIKDMLNLLMTRRLSSDWPPHAGKFMNAVGELCNHFIKAFV